MNKALGLLGLAKKAGRTAVGAEGVRALARNGGAKLVIMAADASENTKKRVRDCCAHYGIRLIESEIGKEELGKAVGSSGTGAVAVCDEGFASAIAGRLEERDGACLH